MTRRINVTPTTDHLAADALTATAAPLFEPFEVGGLTLPNRIVMAPMTRELSPDGVPGPDVAAYYARRAAHGVGLIITEGTVIDHPASASSTAIPRFHGADALAGWARVVESVHAAGGRIIPQLWHVGLDPLVWGKPPAEVSRVMPAGVTPVSPSGIDPSVNGPGGTTAAQSLSRSEISQLVESFARAAAAARRLGFDGIELHGAHGYLIDQFLWEVTNQREDDYGGSPENRVRFAAEIVEACRTAAGPGFPIFFRFSQWKVGHFAARLAADPAQLEALLSPLVRAGVDVFHCSTRRFWQPEFDGSPLNLAGWTKKVTGRPTVTVGSIGMADSDFLTYLDGKGAESADVGEAAARLARGEFDLVALGRALIADPAWPERVRATPAQPGIPFRAEMLTSLS
jgi:2,4-dienoyl-CoA reductase-like NADH-dependent reductase (Old Yellow Enzyme family)